MHLRMNRRRIALPRTPCTNAETLSWGWLTGLLGIVDARLHLGHVQGGNSAFDDVD